jgi:hypothetical protein
MGRAESQETRPARRKAILCLFSAILVIDLFAGIYHSTHGGFRSGPTEICFAAVLFSLGFFYVRSTGGSKPAGISNRYRITSLAILTPIAATLFYLSIYHFFTHGWRSGCIELSLTAMLGTLAWLISGSR